MEPQKNHERALAVLIIATLFSAARNMAGTPSDAKSNFDAADEYIAEAERRGLDLSKRAD